MAFIDDIQSRDTALFPVVTFSDSFRISTKSFTLDGENYSPLLLSSPSIKESIDLENRKYKISNVSLKISNVEYNGLRFTDTQIPMNTEVLIHWVSPSCTTVSECYLAYQGTVRAITHDEKTCNITLEDISQSTLHRDVPVEVLDTTDDVSEKYRNKPYPMVYGRVDRSPVVIENTLNFDTWNSDNLSESIDISFKCDNLPIMGGYLDNSTHYNYLSNNVGYSPLYIYDDNYYKVPYTSLNQSYNDAEQYSENLSNNSNFIFPIKVDTGAPDSYPSENLLEIEGLYTPISVLKSMGGTNLNTNDRLNTWDIEETVETENPFTSFGTWATFDASNGETPAYISEDGWGYHVFSGGEQRGTMFNFNIPAIEPEETTCYLGIKADFKKFSVGEMDSMFGVDASAISDAIDNHNIWIITAFPGDISANPADSRYIVDGIGSWGFNVNSTYAPYTFTENYTWSNWNRENRFVIGWQKDHNGLPDSNLGVIGGKIYHLFLVERAVVKNFLDKDYYAQIEGRTTS